MTSLAISPDGRRIVMGSYDKTVAVWDLEAGTLIQQLSGHQTGVNSVLLSPDRRRIVSWSWDNTIAVWDLEAGTLLHQYAGHQSGVNSVTVIPDGRRIVSGSWGRTVAVLDLEAGTRLATLTLVGGVLSPAWHCDGRFVVAADAGGNLYRLAYCEP